jgi:hypothetical protein
MIASWWFGTKRRTPRSAKLDLSDPKVLRRAIRQANPAAGDFLDVEQVAARYLEIPEHEFRRYYLNQWAMRRSGGSRPPSGSAAGDRGQPDDETEIVLALEGNSSRESVALVGATIEDRPHLFVVQTWQKSAQVKKAPVDEIEDAITKACERWTCA